MKAVLILSILIAILSKLIDYAALLFLILRDIRSFC
jgi:hypothetical protein